MSKTNEQKNILYLYNSLTNKKDAFKPIDEDNIRMYICGPTVYKNIHVGNARPTVVFDILFRLLKYMYTNVTYIRNITDVDDKIIAEAEKNSESPEELAMRITKSFQNDMQALGNLPPTIEPKATEHIPEMIDIIQKLIAREYAYESEGHVFFDTTKFKEYGEISKIDIEQNIAGFRVEASCIKKHPADFVLWKPCENQPVFESPWGYGRPGWHLECSAMSMKYLGKELDIHGGGHDLMFPHHENSNAQSKCAYGTKVFSRFWLHNGMINFGNKKMSKSEGNIVSLKDAIKEFSGPVVRYFLLTSHYRKDMTWSDEGLIQSRNSLLKLLSKCESKCKNNEKNNENSQKDDFQSPIDGEIINALMDDLNTSMALTRLHELSRIASDKTHEGQIAAELLMNSMKFLSIFCSKDEILKHDKNISNSNEFDAYVECANRIELSELDIMEKILQRNEARKNKNFALSDQIRQELENAGVVLHDSKDETTFSYK
jgi:cysteinyl-tRNA synthetase